MVDYTWPEAEDRRLLGKRISRLDGPAKVSGSAVYTYDVNRPNMLYASFVRCPHAHARIRAIDIAAAKNVPGVVAVKIIQEEGTEIQWAHDEIVVVAAESEEQALDGVRAVAVSYEPLPHFVNETDLEAAPSVKEDRAQEKGDVDAALAESEVVAAGEYGLPSIAHSCLEAHGQVCEWEDETHLTAWCSTQGVSILPPQFAEKLDLPIANVRVLSPYMGGGFGSKFSADRWGIVCAELARETGRPVKLMLEREGELAVAGDRPSAYAKIKVGAKQDGTLLAWHSRSWGSGGPGGSGSPPLPYVFSFEHMSHAHSSVPTNVASSRAWRAPNHPQACLLTMAALEDTAAALRMDPLQLFLKNIDRTGPRADIYRQELEIGARLMDWKAKWHQRGEGDGSVRRGLGLSLHTWGGRAHRSNCEVKIHADGSVEASLGSQDLGTGTRTVIAIVVAESLGLPLHSVKVNIGDSRYPPSGPSGGSTTVGGVSSSCRRAAINAREKLLQKLAEKLGADPSELRLSDGKLLLGQDQSVSWKEAASRIGPTPISATGANPGAGKLNDSGVGGIQMADVSVDIETGVVAIDKMVAVQDCGLVIDLKTAESQVYGGMIMGISYALTEEKIMDPVSGRLLNTDYETYRIATLRDVGELVVHMMTGPGFDERGVIGLGEPPVISPGAAISNAVANAVGVRVPHLPLTPQRVLDAIEAGGRV